MRQTSTGQRDTPGRVAELRRRAAGAIRESGSTKKVLAALRASGIQKGLRRLQQERSDSEAPHVPGVVQRYTDWLRALAKYSARVGGATPWPLIAHSIDVTAEAMVEGGGCRRTLFRAASRLKGIYQAETDNCRLILAEEWDRTTLRRFLRSAVRELGELACMVGLARVELRAEEDSVDVRKAA